MSEPDYSEQIKRQRQEEAAANPSLKGVPFDKQRFFQAFAGPKGQSGKQGVMNLKGKARPEELKALEKLNWDGESDIPVDLAEQLRASSGLDFRSDEEVMEEMQNMPVLTLEKDLKEVPYTAAPDDKKKAFDDMLKRMEASVAPKTIDPVIIDSSKKRQRTPVLSSTPPEPPSLPKTKPLAEIRVQQAATTITPPVVEEKTKPVETETNKPPQLCKRCKWNQDLPYPANPTEEDITNRIISIASVTQGGDGRFRKTYSIFKNTITLHFRELTTEGDIIYKAEGAKTLSADTNIAYAQQLFSVDRMNFRRHCCGLEAIESPAGKITIPSLQELIKQYGSPEEALSLLEAFVREKCYSSESVLLAAGRCWVEFENLVTALWSDQSFYNGTP